MKKTEPEIQPKLFFFQPQFRGFIFNFRSQEGLVPFFFFFLQLFFCEILRLAFVVRPLDFGLLSLRAAKTLVGSQNLRLDRSLPTFGKLLLIDVLLDFVRILSLESVQDFRFQNCVLNTNNQVPDRGLMDSNDWLTTCFRQFFSQILNSEIYQFFTKYYVMFVLIAKNCKKKDFWTNKKFVFFFTYSQLRNIRGKNW